MSAPATPERSAEPQTPAVKLSVLTLAVMNVAAVVSLRGFATEAEYGLGSIFYFLFAAVAFLIPVSLVAAELAAMLPQRGGVFRWVGEAFGGHVGFLAIWLLWIESTIWFPTVLTFAAVSLAFLGPTQTWDQALAANKVYVLLTCVAIYWIATLVNLRGVAAGATLSKYGALIGTIIPGAIIIVLGILWVALGKPVQMSMQASDLVPDLTEFSNLVLASSIFLFYAGMEMNAVHVREIHDPTRNYPRAIFLSSGITVLLFVLGTLAVSIVIPKNEIDLTQSLLVAYFDYLDAFGLGFLAHVVAFALGIGVLAGVSTWIGGPSRGLLSVGHAGYLPRFMQKTNKHGVQVNILLIQGALVTVLLLLFVVLPSVQDVYQLLSQLTVMLYLIMYMLMFAAAIYLRFRSPDMARPYSVPGGRVGMLVIGGLGLLAALLAYSLSFLPPSQIEVGSTASWVALLAAGNVLFVAMPFVIYAFRRPSWDTERSDDELEPFSWQKQAASTHGTEGPDGD
ncbi:MAG: putative glutamine/gamma-aminobutyrate antiporter GadC [Myxococcota bacterium]